MAYFPKFDPFYEPNNEHQLYGEQDGRLRLRRNGHSREYDLPNGPPANQQEGWSNIIQGSENLFYTENIDNSAYQGQQQNESAYHSRQASYQSVGSYHSSNSDSPRQQFHRQNSHSSNRSSHSQMTGLNRNATGNQDGQYRREQFQRENTLRQSDQSYDSFTRNFNAQPDQGLPRTSQRVPVKTMNNSFKNTPSPTYSQSGKRKSVFMNPNVRNIDDITKAQGVELCEKLFGIKLCHYKQKPPRPNGASVDPVLRDRKVIVQGVVQDSQADICALINRGDMLVGLNDNDLTWVNIDDMFRQASHMKKVKITFQVPVVVGPKSATPPVTPTRNTPPLPVQTPPPVPPHVPLRIPLTPPPRPPVPPNRSSCPQDLITLTTGETRASLSVLLGRYLFAVMYLTFSGQSENSKDDIVYQYPDVDNKLVDLRGLFLTLSGIMPDVTGNMPKLTTVNYRGLNTHIVYLKSDQDVLLLCLPENRVPPIYLLHIFTDLIKLIKVLYGSVQRVFRDRECHSQLDELISLTLFRILQTGVQSQAIPHCNPLEPVLLDTLTGIRWLRLNADDKISCDEILNEFEAQDFSEFEDFDTEERRKYGIVGTCLFYRDYLLCSHLCPDNLRDVHLYLKYNCILHLVSTQPADDLVLWQEIYPTHLCHTARPDTPGYREPRARWFLLVVSLRHFLLCTVLEAGSYSKPLSVRPLVDQFLLEHSRATLTQLDVEDTDMELQCNERLFSEVSGPTLRCIDSERVRNNNDIISPLKSTPSPRYGHEENLSVHTPNGQSIRRQGSKLSFGSNDSSGSGNSLNKIKSASKKGSMIDIDRSFSRDGAKPTSEIRFTRGLHNQLLHYVNLDSFESVYVSPTPCDLATVQGPTHQHVLYNFYASCLKLHKSFEEQLNKMNKMVENNGPSLLEEGVMFTCHLSTGADSKKQSISAMYWVIGRRFTDGQEMFVCLEDGAPQSLLELAFTYNFGLT